MSEKGDFVYTTGHRQAMCVGLPASEWDDCAAGFRLCLLSKYPGHKQLARVCSKSPALVVHCARQYALDYRRKLGRRREWLWSQCVQEQGETCEYDAPDPDDTLDALLSRIALNQQLGQASVTLSPASLDCLRRRFRDQQSYAEIAHATGKSANAVEQTVSRALKQLRIQLQNQEATTQNSVDTCSSPPPHVHRDQWTILSNAKTYHFFLLNLSGLTPEQR